MVEIVGRVRGQFVHLFSLDVAAVLILGNCRPLAVGTTASSPVVTEARVEIEKKARLHTLLPSPS